jgi:hypothetical protein
MIPIWFFVGCLLTAYGVLILIAAIQSEYTDADANIAMSNLHLQFWWGGIMLVLGLVWVIRYLPRRQKNN